MSFFTKTLLCLFILFFSSCASIVSKSTWPFSVDSQPDGVQVSIVNKAGREVYKGITPMAFKLKSGSGFFSKESYTITLSLNGYETKKLTVDCRLNGWYFGNLLFGGLIGLLVIDPATGAMYRLDSEGVSEKMTKTTVTSLNIITKEQLSADQQQHLVKLN